MIRVLDVDDSQMVRDFLQAILEGEQYEVVTASDGTDGLAMVRQTMPDLIVTDSLMPGLDGFAFLRTLRADPATVAIPVIMLTSEDPQDPEVAVREPRPDAVVRKSADLGPLLEEVRLALQRQR